MTHDMMRQNSAQKCANWNNRQIGTIGKWGRYEGNFILTYQNDCQASW